MQKNLIFIISLLSVLAPLMQACEPHRIDVQQGNRVKPEALQQLKPGMSQKQVTYLLGTPLLKDPFHADRWDYVYYLKPGNDKVRQSRLTLHFKDGILSHIDDSQYRPEMHGDTRANDFDVNDPPGGLTGGLGDDKSGEY